MEGTRYPFNEPATHLQDASFYVTFSQAFSKVNPPSCPCIL